MPNVFDLYLTLRDTKERFGKLFFMASVRGNSSGKSKYNYKEDIVIRNERKVQQARNGYVIWTHINKTPPIGHYCRFETNNEYIEGSEIKETTRANVKRRI